MEYTGTPADPDWAVWYSLNFITSLQTCLELRTPFKFIFAMNEITGVPKSVTMEIAVRTTRDFLERETKPDFHPQVLFTLRTDEEVMEIKDHLYRYFPIVLEKNSAEEVEGWKVVKEEEKEKEEPATMQSSSRSEVRNCRVSAEPVRGARVVRPNNSSAARKRPQRSAPVEKVRLQQVSPPRRQSARRQPTLAIRCERLPQIVCRVTLKVLPGDLQTTAEFDIESRFALLLTPAEPEQEEEEQIEVDHEEQEQDSDEEL